MGRRLSRVNVESSPASSRHAAYMASGCSGVVAARWEKRGSNRLMVFSHRNSAISAMPPGPGWDICVASASPRWCRRPWTSRSWLASGAAAATSSSDGMYPASSRTRLSARRSMTRATPRPEEAALTSASFRGRRRSRPVWMIAGRTVERRPVRQHAARGPEPQLAELQERLVDGQLEEPPGVRAHRAGPQLDLSVDVTVVLLEMLGLEERPLGPDDAIVPGHGWLTFT